MTNWKLYWSIAFLLVLSGCGGSGGGISVTAHFVKGGTATREAANPSRPRGTPWAFSPDKGIVTFTTISFSTTSSLGANNVQATLSNCQVTYDRAAASGSSLLDCPMVVPAGTYKFVSICFSKNTKVLINDPSVPLYTNPTAPTRLTTSSSGVDYVTYTGGGSGLDPCFGIPLPTPYTVSAASPAAITIITDMTRTIPGTLDTGTYSFVENGASRPVEIVAVPGTGGTSEYYSDAASFVRNGPTGEKFSRVSYDSAGAPVALGGLAGCDSNGPAYAYAFTPTEADNAGVYLGLDTNNLLGWAIPNTADKTKASVFNMNRVTAIGASSTFRCKSDVTPIPTPTSGNTYASGAPTISSPDITLTMRLWVK